MNIAILFYGQLRWYDLFNKSYQEKFLPAFKSYNIQCFSHFWSQQDNPNIEEFGKIYKPTSLIVEPQAEFSDIKMRLGAHKTRFSEKLYSQLYSLNRSFNLLGNQRFDMYIKMRTDMIFLDNVDINNFDDNSVYTNKTTFSIDKYINDFIFFTKNYDNVKTIANMGYCLDNIIDLLDKDNISETPWHRCPNEFAPEEILSKHLTNNNIVPKHFDFTVDLARHHGN